ncbi:MAG: hypothetical protein H0V33_03270 [Acidimicrobiia bacterium]|jgi:hypothetical protein|nr:hypothetical protein [Acidimicrobiia bacterium]
MDVRSDRRYRFAVEPAQLWAVLARTDDYRGWWPWLRHLDGAALVPGTVWDCVVQPPLPYVLRFTLRIVDVDEERSVVALVDGDLTGDARLDIAATGDGSELHLVSRLAPSNAVLRSVARLAAPVVRFGHDWVLDTGVRQFRERALPPER